MPWQSQATARAVSTLGEPWLLLPLAGILALALAIRRDRGEAAAWLAAVMLCVGAVVALKVAGYALAALADLARNPFNVSGHAAFGAIVHGGIGLEAARRARGRSWPARVVALSLAGLCVLVVLAIAWSRPAMGAHTGAETAAGVMVGALGLWLWRRPWFRGAAARTGPLTLAAFAALALFWGGMMSQRIQSERIAQEIGRGLAAAAASLMAAPDGR